MFRRTVLKSVAALPLLSLSHPPLAAPPATGTARRRLRPADAAWPAAAEWQELRAAVGGNLLEVRPLFGACESAPDGAACLDVYKNIRNPFYIGDQPGGTQVSGYLNAWTPAPSVWAVRARHAADVAAAVNFARTHNLRLVVKGGAHSYLGTSNAPDSLLIWTRAMKQVTLHDAFVARGCEGKVPPVPAVSSGAGAVWIDLYGAVTTRAGRYVQGGGCTSVGVAGLIQSGGFGSFSKGFGNAAAGLLEAEVVTADGQVRIVNACTDPDLFWALKGGGGGTFGVVTRLTLRTHALPEYFGAAWGTVKANSDDAFRRLIERFLAFYASSLANPHWGEQVAVQPGNSLKISMVQQGLGREEARAVWKPFFDWIGASADYTATEELGAGARKAQSWWQIEGNRSMIPDLRADAAPGQGWWQGDQDQVGAYLHGYDSLWLPASLLKEAGATRLTQALFAASRHQEVGLHFNKGLAFAPSEAIRATLDTAMNPAVTEAFALAIIADGERPSYPGMKRPPMDLEAARSDAHAIDLATQELRRLAPQAGSYLSESNYFNKAWQRAYFGEHYPRLQAIKKKYDPAGLFFVHNGVGSEEWSADGFTRVSGARA
ncbi:MAG TPA: FAD-binding protein [Steroidobacteraceae bacterium]|nr:FAD-binding protein [Steroidobacteraceae bacterium]